MNTEMGEFVVGAYLKLIGDCDFVDYNVRRPGGGLAGLNEIDVVGLNFKNKTTYICEVTTHLEGALYGSGNEDTIKRIKNKVEKLQSYGKDKLSDFPTQHYMFWSPKVSWSVESELRKVQNLELVMNQEYAIRVKELEDLAKKTTHDTGNPAFRLLQILGHLKLIRH